MRERAGDRATLAHIELLRFTAHRMLGQREAARSAAQRARRLPVSLKDVVLEVTALVRLAHLAEDTRDLEQERSFLDQALPLAEKSGDSKARALVFEGLGRHGISAGDTRAADYLARAIKEADAAGDIELRIRTRGARVTALLGRRFDEALADAQAAYELARGPVPPSAKAVAIYSLAQANDWIRNLERTAALWTEAIGAYPMFAISTRKLLKTKTRVFRCVTMLPYWALPQRNPGQGC